MIDPNKMPMDMSIEELLWHRESFINAKEEMEASVAVFNEEIIKRLTDENVNGMVVGNRALTKVTRTNYAVTLEQAKQYGAVLTKETVDMEMIRALANKGTKFETTKTEYLTVKEIKKSGD